MELTQEVKDYLQKQMPHLFIEGRLMNEDNLPTAARQIVEIFMDVKSNIHNEMKKDMCIYSSIINDAHRNLLKKYPDFLFTIVMVRDSDIPEPWVEIHATTVQL